MSVSDLKSAIVQDDRERYDDLIEAVDPTERLDSGTTVLSTAARFDRTTIVEDLLDRGLDPDVADGAGRTPLYVAAREGSTESVRLLLAAGADVHAEDEHGNPPLQKALYRGHPEVVRLLLEHGANPNHHNKHGNPIGGEGRIPDDWPDEVADLYERRRQELPATYSDPDVTGLAAGHERVPVESFDDGEALRDWMWDELVPLSGQADTVQGELLRGVEKLRDEAHRNGNANWFEDYERLIDYMQEQLCEAGPFDDRTARLTRADLDALRGGEINDDFNDDIYARLRERVVEYCEHRPELIAKPEDEELRI